MKVKLIRWVLAVLAVAPGAVSAQAAGRLVVAQGVTTNLTDTFEMYEAAEIHGTLNVFRASGTDKVGFESGVAAAACSLGSGAGDRATVAVGDYGHIWGGIFTVGGPDATGSFVVGGKRPGDETGTSDDDHAHLALGGLCLSSNAMIATGVIDVLQLNPGAAVGLIPHASHQRIVNASPSADARLLFNGGWFGVFNVLGDKRLFTTVHGEEFPDDVPEGKGGRAIILEGIGGNAVDFRIAGGSTSCPCCGTVNFRGACDVRLSATEKPDRTPYGWKWDQPASSWQQTGDLCLGGWFVLSCEADDVLPRASTNGIVRVGDFAQLDLKGRYQTLNGLMVTGDACLTNSSSGLALMTFGSVRPDAGLSVSHVGGDGLITACFKGSGTFSVSNTPSFPAFDVRSGTLRVTGDCNVRRLTLKKGARLVVDGGTLTVTESMVDGGATFTGENGGRLTVGQDSAADSNFVLGSGTDIATIAKTGPGRLTLYSQGTVTAGVHVAAGTLGFAVPGTTARWFRFSFRRMPGNSAFRLSELWLLDKDGKATDDRSYMKDCSANEPKDMERSSIWASDRSWMDKGSDSTRQYGSPKVLFDGSLNSLLGYETSVDPLTPSSWKVFVLRLPRGTTVTSCYDFRNGFCGSQHPSEWSVETSTNGLQWTLVDEQLGQAPASGNDKWYNADAHYSLYAGLTGAAGLAAGCEVRVDRGAVFDASGVTGGQVIDTLAVDCSPGTGEAAFRNVRLADTGTLNLLGDWGDSLRCILPCVFEDSVLPQSFDGWTVYRNGRLQDPEMYRLYVANGRIVIRYKGGALFFVR